MRPACWMCGTIAWDPRTHTHTHTAKHTATLTLTLLLKPTQPLKPQRVHKVMQRHKRLHALAARRAGAARVLGDQVAPLTHPATAAAAAAVRQSCRPLPPLTTHLWMQSRIFAKCSTASASTRPRSGSNRAHSRLRRKQLLPSDAARSMSCSYRRQKSQLCVRVCGRGEGGARQYLSRLAAARRRAAKVVTLSGFNKANPLRAMGDLNLHVPSGEYGYVELLHCSLCHCALDALLGIKTD